MAQAGSGVRAADRPAATAVAQGRHPAQARRDAGYCTCSLEAEEGEEAITELLASEPAVRRAPVDPSEVAGLTEIVTAQGDLRTLPCHLPNPDPRLGGLDGFYAARLVKI